MLAFKNNENKPNYNNHFLANFKSSNQCQLLSLLEMKCYLIALRKLKILVTGIISIVIVVIVVIISDVVVVIGFGIWFWKLMYRRLHSALFLMRILWLQLP